MTIQKQSGNVLLFVLIAILLIGLLTISLTRSSNNTNETGSYEQNVIVLNQIMRYAKNIENAITQLLARGCSENELSFENNVVAGYTNANAPADNSCHLFEPEGAGLTWETPPATVTALPYEIFGETTIHGVGTTDSPLVASNADLVIYLPDIPVNLCTIINRTINNGVTAIPEDGGDIIDGADAKFTGTYTNVESVSGEVGATICPAGGTTPLCGITTGCFKEETGNEYNLFYHVLYAR